MKLQAIILLFLCIGINSYAQNDVEIGNDPELRKKEAEKAKNSPNIIDVTDNIFMLKGMGGNITVHYGIDGVLMIDSKFEKSSEAILDIIEDKAKLPLEFVINTHGHGDHTGGNKSFKRSGATIIAHENTKNMMLSNMYKSAEQEALANLDKDIDEARQSENSGDKLNAMEVSREQLIARMKEKATESLEIDYEMLPAIVFQNDMLFHYNDEDIKLKHLSNAHTKGDITVYFPKSNLLHTGDAFVNKMYPFIDTENGGSYKGYQKGLTYIMNRANKDTKIIPGHGELADKVDVAEMRQMMKIFYDKVSIAYMLNKTENEVAQMRDFSKRYDDMGYGDGFITTEKFLRSVYKAVDKDLRAKKEASEKRGKALKEAQKKLNGGR